MVVRVRPRRPLVLGYHFPDLSVESLYLYATVSVRLSEGERERERQRQIRKEGEGVEHGGG